MVITIVIIIVNYGCSVNEVRPVVRFVKCTYMNKLDVISGYSSHNNNNRSKRPFPFTPCFCKNLFFLFERDFSTSIITSLDPKIGSVTPRC